MATVSSTGFSSGGTKDWTSAASAKPGDSVDRADGSSIGSTRRRGGERRRSSASASNAPPPPGSPPPRLARRASQRDTEPTRRKASSAHGGGGDVPHGTTRHKDDQVGRAPGVARTRCVKSSKGRPSYLVPPPADSPPFVASPHEEVIKRRRNSKAVAGRPRDIRRGGFASVGNRQHPGRSSDSGSNSDSNSNSKRSNSSSSISEVRDRHYISDNSGGSSGEAGKTYLAVDDIMSASEDNSGDRKMGSARGSEYSSFSKRDSCISRDGKQRCFGWDHVDEQFMKSSRDRAEAYPLENGHRHHRRSSFSRSGNHGNRERQPLGDWVEQSAAQAAASPQEDSDNNNQEEDGLGFHHRTSGRSKNRVEKARGSETTATPSPRDHPSGSGGLVVGESLVDGLNEGVMGWAAEPVTDSRLRGRRRSWGLSAGNTASPRKDSTRLSLHSSGYAHDNGHGSETCESATSSAPRRIGDSGDDEDRPRRGRTPSTTKNHSSHDHNGTGSSAEERASSRRSPGIGKPTRRRDRTSRGTSRGDTKRSHRHRTSPTRDKEFLEDTVGEGSSSFARTERPSVGVMENEKGGRESRKKEPRAGGWFVPPEEEEKEEGGRKECSNVEEDDDGDDGDDDDDDDDDDASKGSDPDTTLCSKRLHDSKGGNLLKGGKSDEGLAPDESEGNDHGARGGRCWGEVYEQMPARCNSLMLSYDRGNTSDLVQCIIVRDRSGLNRLYPQYRFFFEGRREQLMMIAQKCSKNRTSNYHVFDMKRGGFRARLSKKNGNYLGKVRTNLKRTEATVFTNDQEVAELGAISFEKPGLVDHLRDGSQPRKFSVLLPALDCHGAPVAHKVDPYDADSDMLSCIKQGRYGNMFLLQSREPTYTKGNYRLNFHGRVTVPSVKNFQLSSPDDKLHTVCQFGKVGEDRFHLDYRAPINAFQAFCISLAQFNF